MRQDYPSLPMYLLLGHFPLTTFSVSAYDEGTHLLYLSIFQIFAVWFIPFYRAPVRLVTVLHLTPSSSRGGDSPPPPPPCDAAQDKLHAVQEGSEPSYAAVTAGEPSTPPTRYLIAKQQDLYQVNEFLKFVTLTPGSIMAGFLQLLATLLCLTGSVVLGPCMDVVRPVGQVGGEKEKNRC